MKNSVKSLSELLSSCDSFPLECDGLSSVIDYILTKNGIDHQCYRGYVDFQGRKFKPHWWIVVGKYLIDYRMRMWFGNDAPHGVFKIKKVNEYDRGILFKVLKSGIEHGGLAINMGITDALFTILAGKSYDQWEIDRKSK